MEAIKLAKEICRKNKTSKRKWSTKKRSRNLKSSNKFFRKESKELEKALLYDFMKENKNIYKVNIMCKVLFLSEQGYYKHIQKSEKPYKYEILLAKILEIRDEELENGNYGIKRIHMALANQGFSVSLSTIRRIMAYNDLFVKIKRKMSEVTKVDKNAEKSENILNQDFNSSEPNRKWLSDITEVPCIDGKLYVCPVLDCFDGSIVGLSMDNNMRKELVIEALKMAVSNEKPENLIFHSDRGSQFTSGSLRNLLNKNKITLSMSGVGRCYNNARAESFFATLKKEKIYKINTKAMKIEEVKTIIFRYIMVYYNQKRIYTSNPAGLAPMAYRDNYFKNLELAV